MKKILVLGIILTVICSASASAQVSDGTRLRHQREVRAYHRGDLTRVERRRLHHDGYRYHMARRRAGPDGSINRHERRHLAMMRTHDRRELYRYRHNNHRRVI